MRWAVLVFAVLSGAPRAYAQEPGIKVDCSRPELGPESGFKRLRREEPEYEGVMDIYAGRGRKLRTTCFQDGGLTLDLEFTPKADPSQSPKLMWYREAADFLDQVMAKGRHAEAWKAISKKIRDELKKKKPDLEDLPKNNVAVRNAFAFGSFRIAPDKNTVQVGQIGFFGQVKEGELRGTHLLEISWSVPEEPNAD